MKSQHVAILGSGIFGVTAALALRGRGYAVSLIDPGPLPHPLAASTDISKTIRLDYGSDEEYTVLAERSLEGWRRWNAEWPEPLFHECGVASLCRSVMTPGGFEYASYHLLRQRGHWPERLDASALRRRFPAWNADRYPDGYFNPEGGYAESGKVVTRLLLLSERQGVRLVAGQRFARLEERGSRVAGIVTASGDLVPADWVVATLGAWTPHILPFTAPHLRSVGQPVFHLQPTDPWAYQPGRFPVFGADVANTGYYGFPANRSGVVKIANHGPGRPMHPESPERAVRPEDEAQLRQFLRETFPGLVAAPVVFTRVCLYCDTWDGHFWIARDPQREGLVVASGDSGHGFKFAPVLGEIIADALEGASAPVLSKFRWRPEVQSTRSEEASRYQG